MMKGFKLTDLLGEQPPATTTNGGEWDIQHIPLEQITPAKNNNYRICDIESLADSIQADGLQAPLVVRLIQDSGQYELISGERRYTAIKSLRDKGIAGYDIAPCKVKDNVSDLAAEIQLIRANATARVLTDQEKVTQAARLSELLGELKSGGVKVPGRKRSVIADLMGVSTAQVGRMESVDKNLVTAAKAEFQQGNMNFSTAYETSLLPAEQQEKVVEDLQQGEKVDIKAVKQRRQPAPPPRGTPQKATIAPRPAVPPPKDAPPIRRHELKTWPQAFDAVASGLKTFEYRKNDRDYQQGDILHLRRYNPNACEYTGQTLDVTVTYILHGGEFGIPQDHAIMSITAKEV